MNSFDEWIESCVKSVTLVNNHEVHITLEKRNRKCLFRAEGMERLLINEFREQNVVEKINLWNFESETADYYTTLAELISGTDEIPKEFLPILEGEVLEIRQSKKVLLEIEPIAGARITILAKNIVMTVQG